MSPRQPRGTMQTTRLRKVECPSCGVIARMSRTALQRSGLPFCGCGTQWVCPDLDDLAAVAPDHELLTEAAHALERYAWRSLEQQNRYARIGQGPDIPNTQDARFARGMAKGADVVARRVLAAHRASAPAPEPVEEIPF